MGQGKWVDDVPEEERRSPSPEPIYNEAGARINTREQRAKDKLLRQRNVGTCLGAVVSIAAAAVAAAAEDGQEQQQKARQEQQ